MRTDLPPARALVIDDLDLLGIGLTQLLRRAGSSTVTVRRSDDRTPLPEPAPDLVVIGPHLRAPLDAMVVRVRAAAPACRVVVLTHTIDRETLLGALEANVDGITSVAASESELHHVFDRVLAGERVLTGLGLPAMGGSFAPSRRDSALTPREREVLALLATRRTLSEIGSELYVSTGTVKRHTAHIYAKLDVRSRRDAVEHAFTLRLIDLRS